MYFSSYSKGFQGEIPEPKTSNHITLEKPPLNKEEDPGITYLTHPLHPWFSSPGGVTAIHTLIHGTKTTEVT